MPGRQLQKAQRAKLRLHEGVLHYEVHLKTAKCAQLPVSTTTRRSKTRPSKLNALNI